MLATQIEVSDGTLNTINVGIQFFNQNDISVSLDQSGPLLLGVDYQWTNATTLEFLDTLTMPGGLVPLGVEVIIRRDTKNDEMYNIMDGGAPFSRLTLDENYKQLLYLSQEFSEGLGLDGLRNNLHMNGYRVVELGDPVDPSDATPKSYVDAADAAILAYANLELSRAIRAPSPETLNPLATAVNRANKVLGFDALGQPVALLPATGSATELALDLANSVSPVKGAAMVGYNGTTVAATLTNQQAQLDAHEIRLDMVPRVLQNVAAARATPGQFAGERVKLLNYNGTDGKGHGRYLTWVVGASTDDGGMYFGTTGGHWLSDLDSEMRVSSEFYGLPLAAGGVCITQDAAIEAFCFANKVSAWYGPGPNQALFPAVYDFGDNNWSWSGVRVAAQALKDYRGVRVFSAPNVTFKTTSALGADVMQCCGIKDFGVIGYPKVTATLTSTAGSGSNALSLVFGCVDCVFELSVFDMPGVYKVDGSIDGGQGFSIQPGTGNINEYKNIRLSGTVDGATQGFGCDFELDAQVDLPLTAVHLDLVVRDCYRGFAVGGAAATVAHTPKAYTGITGSIRIENCQQAFVNLRTVGVNMDVEVINTLPKASLVKHTYNPSVMIATILAAKDGGARITGRVLTVDTALQVGGTTMGGGDFGTTENYDLMFAVSNTGATVPMVVTDSGGNACDKCHISLYNVPSGYNDIINKGNNTLLLNGAEVAHALFPGDAASTSKRVANTDINYTVPVTAFRGVTLHANAAQGDRVRLTRFATATGTGVGFLAPSLNLLAGQYAEATYSGAAWVITKNATAM